MGAKGRPQAASDGIANLVLAAGALTLALLVVPLLVLGDGEPTAPPRSPVQEVAAVAGGYLQAWSRGDFASMALLQEVSPAEFTSSMAAIVEQLQIVDIDLEAESPEVFGQEAMVPFAARLDLAGLGTWDYRGRLDLVFGVAEPVAVATEAVAEATGDRVPAGIETGDTVGEAVVEAVTADEPRWSVRWSPATIHPALGDGQTLARRRDVPARARLIDVADTELTGEAAPDLPSLAAQVLGRVAVSDGAEVAGDDDYALAGDRVGVSGLEAAFNEQLSGRPAGQVQVVDASGEVVEVVYNFPGVEPQPVRTSFDAEIQAAAESALSGVRQPAALVAIDAPTGQIRAVANQPTIGFNRALEGQYPPGSTFKVVTATALLAAGVTANDDAPCPASVSVEGYRFSNAGGEVLGDIPFATAFYRSCNTAFVSLAGELAPGELSAAAESYGFNGDVDLPVAAGSGRFPEPSGPIDAASAAIGQGRVTATPLQMATVAAAVASGSWHAPSMIMPEGSLDRPELDGAPLPEGVAPVLRQLMYQVVSEGTGTAARLGGEPIGGKTGTAEFGSATPPRTHAWFIGFRGDVAVAVVVEDGGFGGSVAAPIARRFFADLG